MLDCKLAALVKDSSSFLCQVKDNLLALQVFILYQFIRLFDGDVRQRVNAERDLELLDSWTLRLHQNYCQVPIKLGKESTYGHWVLVESIRRTTMMSVLLRGAYSVMKDGHCQLTPLMCTLPVSNMARLWKTPETELGNQDLAEKGEVQTYLEWTRQWNAGDVKCIGEYEKLLLVSCRHAIGTGNFKIEQIGNS